MQNQTCKCGIWPHLSSIKSQTAGNRAVSRVLIGPFANEENAQKIINQLSDGQINAALIRVSK